ncbi:MAG TPA: HAD-IA family hydrolase [Bryobacteraceae bacterium]|nr:HAD-IA family hydrolase [Bryobacteraceae bacterium]
MTRPLLIFDMDGVLVEVTESYRETIARTVARFTGAEPTRARIQEYKNRGGFNDDWELSHQLIRDAGMDVPFESVKQCFQEIFLGANGDGLILRERWVAQPGTLERLGERFRMAIFTGRPRVEADLTLNRFAGGLVFDPVVGMFDVSRRKPHPEGLLKIMEAARDGGEVEAYYVGDSVDDARCARAAGVPFIGIAAPPNPAYLDLVFLFQEEKAYAIVDDINYLEEVLAS